MVKYAILCKIKILYFEYRYHERHFCIRMGTIRQPKLNMQNHKHLNPNNN